MEDITIILNGVEVSGYPGMTVLDLARESGVSIPTLCYDPCLVSSGACRLCLVEEESSGSLVAACVTPIRSGMVINTNSPRVIERRKTIIKLMLASHPDSCLICDKGNSCQLRQIASEMGIGMLDIQRIPQSGTIEEVNPFVERDLSKCILCGKCIRADQELVVVGAIDYINRGNSARPATLNCVPLEKSECTFCGTCVALCPTGAIMEKDKTYHGTSTNVVETTCPFCGCGCSISLEIKDNSLIRAKPSKEKPDECNALCSRGSYGLDFVHSQERLTEPIMKVNGEFQPVPWEQALGRIATTFNGLKNKYGADALAIFGSSKCTNEENYLLQRLARGVFGTNNIDNGSRLYNAPTLIGLGRSTGFPGTTNSLTNLEQAGVILVIGADPTVSAPAVGYAIKRAVKLKGAKLILVDPRRTKLASFAHLLMQPKAGTDVALINGLVKEIIDEKMFDEESVTRKTDNFKSLVTGLKSYNPRYVAEITGVPDDDIRTAARLFAKVEPSSIVFGNGITQQVNGVNAVLALSNLAMLTESIGGLSGVFALQRENNSVGACDMGALPDFLPGYQPVDNTQARQVFEERWGINIPTRTGSRALEMIELGAKGQIKGMFIIGENPVASFPNPSLVRQALTSLDFLVVSDLFLSETAKLAEIVLPAASFAEKEGTFTNFEGSVRKIHQAIKPPGKSLPDWTTIIKIADEMGQPMSFSSPQQIWEEITELVPIYHHDDLDVDYEVHDEHSKISETRRLYHGSFPTGFGRFTPVEYVAPTGFAADYPMTLVVGSTLHHFGSGTRSSRASRLKKFSPNSWVEISSSDVKAFGFNEGENIKVISPHGQVVTKVKVSDSLQPGILYMPISFPENPVGSLFAATVEPQSGTPAFKSCAVKLERLDHND